MVALDVVENANATAALATAGTTRPYVAVFTGGTAGIGSYGVLALARNHGKAGAQSRGLRVYIVGRRASEELVAQCRALFPQGQFEFVQAQDLGLLKDVDRVCAAITDLETKASAKEGHPPKIDLLVQTQGVLSFRPRDDTPEGIDHPISLMYYSRARVADRLLPLLLAETTGAGADADDDVGHIVSVLNPSLEGALVLDDLSLRQPAHWTLRNRAGHGTLFNTFYLESLAARHPGRLSCVHYYPGAVATGIASTSPLPWWVKALLRLLTPVFWLIAIKPNECGQRVLFLANAGTYPPAKAEGHKVPSPPAGTSVAVGSDGTNGSGTYRVDWNDDALKTNAKAAGWRAAGAVDKIWAHTQAAFAAVEAGCKFTD